MSAGRFDDFVGDDLTYIGFLYLNVTNLPLSHLISQLEGQVEKSRRVQPQAPCHPGGHSEDDEGQTQRQHESRVGNPRGSQPIEPKDSPSLHVVIWNPTTEYKAAQSSSVSGVWVGRTATFFRSLPVSEEQWRQKRLNAQLSTADGVLRTVDCLVTGSLDPLNNNKCSSAETSASLVAAEDQDSGDTLSASAERAAALIATAEHSQHVAQFFSLVFLAECRVALFTGSSETSVYDAIRKFMAASGGEYKSDKTPRLLLTTMLWVLQEQQRQFDRGLLHRGFELFFNEGKSLSFYIDCPKSTISNARFTAKFPTCNVPDEIHASLALWLPFIVGIRNMTKYSYTTICEALEVTLWSKEEDFQAWRKIYLSRTLVICHLAVDCPGSQPPANPKKLRHHSKKRKRPVERESQTLRPGSIRRFRATGPGQDSEPAVTWRDKSPAMRNPSAIEQQAETAPHSFPGEQVAQPTRRAPVASSHVTGHEYEEQRAVGPVPAFGAVEQAPSRSNSLDPNGSPPGIIGTRHEPPGHGHDVAIARPQNLLNGLRRPSPSNTGPNSHPATGSVSPGWEESRTTSFRPINANGLTSSKDEEADGLHDSNTGGVLAAQEASRVNDPGVDLAGDVSVITPPAPHNIPTLSGAGNGQGASTGPPGRDLGAHSRDIPGLESLADAAAQVDGGALTGEEPADANPEHQSGQDAGASLAGLSLVAVTNAASPLQPNLSAGDQLTDEESLGEAVSTEWMTTIMCPLLPADGSSLLELAPISGVDGSLSCSPAMTVDSEFGAENGQAPPGRTSFRPIHRRTGPTTSSRPPNRHQSNWGGVSAAPVSSPPRLLAGCHPREESLDPSVGRGVGSVDQHSVAGYSLGLTIHPVSPPSAEGGQPRDDELGQMRAAIVPHNRSAPPVDQDAVAATGTTWGDATPAVQEPFPIGTTSDGSPGLELLLVAAGRVNEDEPLQPHNIDPSEEETAGANPEQERGQRAGTSLLSLSPQAAGYGSEFGAIYNEQVELDFSAVYGNPQADPDFGDIYGDPRWMNDFEWDGVFISQ